MDIRKTQIWNEMLSGQPYNAVDPQLLALLTEMRGHVKHYNEIDPTDMDALYQWLCQHLGHVGKNVQINQPFRCDYGLNISIGDNTIVNFGLTILDEALVTIGKNVFIGPNCSIYTPCHPLEPEARNKGIEWSEPVTIGDDCWLGGNVTIVPGVTIGEGTTIGAGSVVVKDIPAHVLAVGNPCKPVRGI